MTLSVELWQLIGLLLTVAGLLAGFFKQLMSKIDRALENRFSIIEKQAAKWQDLERDFLRFQADMAVHYVRREDYVRGQSVIEAKLDALFTELKRVQIEALKGGVK